MSPHRAEPSAERVSVCCAAPEHPDVPKFCSACNEGTGFEPAVEDDTSNELNATLSSLRDAHSGLTKLESKAHAEALRLRADVTKAQGERDALRTALRSTRANLRWMKVGVRISEGDMEAIQPSIAKADAALGEEPAIMTAHATAPPTPQERLRDALGTNAGCVRLDARTGVWLADVFHENGWHQSASFPSPEEATDYVKGALR